MLKCKSKEIESKIDFFNSQDNLFDEVNLTKCIEEKMISIQENKKDELIGKEVFEIETLESKMLCQQYIDCKKMISDMEKKQEMIREKLIQLADGKNIKCGIVTLCSVVKKGAIDYKSIPGMQFVDVDRYRKEPVQYWKINIDS